MLIIIKKYLIKTLATVVLLHWALAISLVQAAPGNGTSLQFNQTQYFHRWSDKGQNEYTPAGQEDLDKWTDMVTINFYPSVKTGEDLASVANTVLTNYQRAKGQILKTDSLPRTPTRPAEHLIVTVLPDPNFLEFAAARFLLANQHGFSIVYSHRIYGKKVGDAMNAWLKQSGEACEKALKAWSMPTLLLGIGK